MSARADLCGGRSAMVVPTATSSSARTFRSCVPAQERYREQDTNPDCRGCCCRPQHRSCAVGQWKARHSAYWHPSMGFEESAFFPDGDCSKKPFWWEYPNQLDKDVGAKWEALGKPPALRLVVRGNLSAFGLHGHLGAYRREVQPIALISVAPASRCRWTWVKEGR